MRLGHYLQVGRARCQRVKELGGRYPGGRSPGGSPGGGSPGGRYPDLLVAPELPGRIEPRVLMDAL